jgi:hypothetical protein
MPGGPIRTYALDMGIPTGEQVVIVIAVMWVLLVLTTAAAITVAVRAVRRTYRSGRERLRRIGGSVGPGHLDLGVLGAVASATVGSPGWWAVQSRRHRMWRSVSSAEHAVDVARRSAAAVGDLPLLVRQLSMTADRVDAVLRASARVRSLRGEARSELYRIEAAAVDIHRAALNSLKLVGDTDTESVVSAIRIEVSALAAGVRAAQQDPAL